MLKEEKATVEGIIQRRTQREKEAAELREREAARLRMPPTIVRYERHSFVVNFVPFGAGQFQNGQRRKGWLFLGAEAVLGAVSVGAFATNLSLYGLAPHRGCKMEQSAGVECPPAQIDHGQEDTSRTLVGVSVVSGGLFWAVAIWGVIDAIYYHQPEVLLPDGAKVARGSASLMGPRLTFSPNGLGAAWAF